MQKPVIKSKKHRRPKILKAVFQRVEAQIFIVSARRHSLKKGLLDKKERTDIRTNLSGDLFIGAVRNFERVEAVKKR